MKIFKNILKFVLFFVAIFVVIFALFNWPAVATNLKYLWQSLANKEYQKVQDTYLSQIDSVKQPTCQELGFADDHIIIQKLDLSVPIVWDSPEDKFLDNLQYGVAHYKNTAKPGEKGNVFIAGHSSSYWWQRGPYSAIFSVIGQLEPGDEINICYNNKVFVYQVTEKFIVKPSQVEVMQPTETPTLTIMTCTPIGTAINRLIIRANQVIP